MINPLVSLRIAPDVLKKIEAQAKIEGRTRSSLILYAINFYLALKGER